MFVKLAPRYGYAMLCLVSGSVLNIAGSNSTNRNSHHELLDEELQAFTVVCDWHTYNFTLLCGASAHGNLCFCC